MRLTLTVLAVVLALSGAGQAGRNPAIASAHRTTHSILIGNVLEQKSCSATAIAPHALLTASHCESASDTVKIDGTVNAKIVGIMRDGLDHSILLVGTTFKDYADFSESRIQVGDDIFLFGNPGALNDVLRKGYVAKVAPNPKDVNPVAFKFIGPQILLNYYDFNGWFGDSGAAVFNSDGEIIGVVSMIHVQGRPNAGPGDNEPKQLLMAGYSLNFSKEAFVKAHTFAPDVEDATEPSEN